MSPHPEMRIGDREREEAAAALGEHYAAGRLTKEEYDERSAVVWAARTEPDLRPVFVDLPPPVTDQQPVAPIQRRRRGGPSLVLLIALVVLLVAVVPGPVWFFLLVGWLWFSGTLRGWCPLPRWSHHHGGRR